mgnify:CR=1 FL=1
MQLFAVSLGWFPASGYGAPGAPLTETALSTRFDVSRGPLREAMRQLIEEGLLVTVPYTGTHVAALSVEDVLRNAKATEGDFIVVPPILGGEGN